MLDLGWLVGNVLGVLVILLTIIFIVWASLQSREWFSSEFGFSKTGSIWIAIAFLVAQFGWNAWWNFPFDMAYHSYQTVSGVVDDSNSRILTTGTGDNRQTSQKYAIRLKGSDQIYGCEDTRCSLARPGDHITLACERQWQYASVPGYDCRYKQ